MSSATITNTDLKYCVYKIETVCNDYKSYDLSNYCKKTIGLKKKIYDEITFNTVGGKRCELKLLPKYLFNDLYNKIEAYSTSYDKTVLLNSFTDDIYGIWVFAYYTPGSISKCIDKLSDLAINKLDGNNIDDFIKEYNNVVNNNNISRKVHCYGFDNNKAYEQELNARYTLTNEDQESLQKMAEYLKSKMNNENIKNSNNRFAEFAVNDSMSDIESESESDNDEIKPEIKIKPAIKIGRINPDISSESSDESNDESDNESESNDESNDDNIEESNDESNDESMAETNDKIEQTINESNVETIETKPNYTWSEVEEYKEINLNKDKIPEEIYNDTDDDYVENSANAYKDKTVNYDQRSEPPAYEINDMPKELTEQNANKQYTIDSPEIKELIKKFMDSELDIDYLKTDDIGCKYYKCDNFLNNIIGREVNTENMIAYANMIMKVRLGMMPYKRVNRKYSNEKFNAFCSNLTEIKSVDDKQHILDTSIEYKPEFKQNYYKYNELCEYIITDYQRLVFDIDVESKKTFNKNKEDEHTIEYSLNDETIDKIYNELLVIQFIFEACKKVNSKAKLYAFIQYGNRNYWSDEAKEEHNEITKKIFNAFNEEVQYITEFNRKSSKLLSIHFSISGIVYNRKENEYLRQFLMGKIPTSDYVNGKQVIDNLEFLDKSIYVFTQRAWRFAYSCKQQKKECELPFYELTKHKTILYNLFAYPEKDDVEINLCDKLYLNIDTYEKINTAIKQKNSRLSEIYKLINSALQTMDFNKKAHTINKPDDIMNFVNNNVELPERFECLIKHPVIVEKLHKLQNNVQGYPNIRKNVLRFINDCRIMNLDEDNIYNLLLSIEYYHTDGTPNRNKSMIKNLVKLGFKNEIHHTMQLSTDVTNERTKNILRYRYWLKEDLINFLKRLIFKIGIEYVIKEPSSSKKGVELKFYKFADIKEIFSFNVNVFTPYYYKENGKRASKDDYDELSIELSSIHLPTLIRNINLPEYNEINVCVTQNTLKQSGTYAEGFKSYNKYNVHIGYNSDDNPVYDCMKKDKCVRNLSFKDRPKIINDIFKNLLYSPNITDDEFELRKNYFEALFAYKIQNPDMAVQISPIICGAEGICKNTYFGILNGFLNGWCEDELSWDIEMSNFNSRQQDNIIRCYNEVKSTPAAASKLKALITDAMETVNEKHEKRKSSRNLALKVFLTNERQNNLLNSGSNRRFLYYTPPTTTEEGMELSKKIYINGQIDKKIINDYKNYIFRLDLSKFKINNELFNPMQKNNASFLDDMVDFREQFNVVKDTTTQFLDRMVETFNIPEFTNKKHFIPTMFIVAIGNACKNGYTTLDDNEFDFGELCNWYRDNVNEKTTWNAKSIATRLKENDSSYVIKGETRIAELCKKIDSIENEQLKQLLSKYYKTRVRGFLG